ncbi:MULTISPECIES: hypothetical protein [unclassified Burkholderia]|uniref:hypothetical protein n=1 Tax=unclassified Burkholderia TaxID=2613784 RepID=UPI002ABE6301|nr:MULTISPECIES: hypothetical protein [unclassified Burkholderia]
MVAIAAIVAGTAAAATSEIEPSRMKFSGLTSVPYFELNPPALNDFSDNFASTGTFTSPGSTSGSSFTVASNQGTIALTSGAANQNYFLNESSGTNVTIPQFFVQVDVPSIPSPGTSSYDALGIGLCKDTNNYVYAEIDRLGNVARVEIKIAGTSSFLGNSSFTLPSTNFTLGFSLVGNSAGVWFKNNATGGAWQSLATADVSSKYDFRTSGNLTGWKAGLILASGNNSTWKFANLMCGRFGGVGMRDMCIVTNEDGAPYFSGNKVYFSASVPDATGASYMGIFTLDLSSNTLAQAGAVMFSRSGKAYTDLAGHIIWYSNGNRRVLVSTWGNGFGGSILLNHALLTSGDILAGTSLVTLSPLTVPLGTSGAGAYDPMLLYDSSTSLWWLAYSITNNTSFSGNPFYAALATSPDLSTWTLVGADTANTGYEGTRILRANKKLWVLAGGPSGAGNSSRIYDSGMNYIGSLPAAVFSGGSSTQPHPMVFNDVDGKHQTLFTFDNTKFGSANFTWGQPTIQKSPRFW